VTNIETLEYLARNIPMLDPLTSTNIIDNVISFNVNSGEIIAGNLLHKSGIAIADCYASSESSSIRHNHEEKEWILVYNGSISVKVDGLEPKDIKRLTKNGDEVILEVGDYIFIPPRVPHVIKSSNGAKFIAVTIPNSAVFPTNDARI